MPRSGLDEFVASVVIVLAEDAPLVDPPTGGVAFLPHDPLERLPDDLFIGPKVPIRPDATLLEHHLPVFEFRARGARPGPGPGPGLADAAPHSHAGEPSRTPTEPH